MGDLSALLPTDERGVSEVLSYIFIFSLVAISISIVSVGGMTSLEDARTAEQSNNAEQAFDVLHDNMGELYSERAPSRATELSLGDTEAFYGDNVTVTVSLDGTTVYDGKTRPIVQRLGDDRRLVYEAGAVFRTNRDSGRLVRNPPFTLRSDSANVPIAALKSSTVRSIGGTTVLVRAKVTDRSVVASDTSGSVSTLSINVSSPRADHWKSYFEDQPSMTCPDEGDGWVKCEHSNPDTVYVVVHEAELSLIP